MTHDIHQAFITSIQMLEDGIGKISDERWREGGEAYLVPARIAYHILVGLEWFVSTAPPREHLRTRRFQEVDVARGLGSVDELPDRRQLLEGLAWISCRVNDWFAEWAQEAANGTEKPYRLKKALYFLRHTQHHIGEFSAAARLLGLKRPAWPFIPMPDLALILKTDGPVELR